MTRRVWLAHLAVVCSVAMWASGCTSGDPVPSHPFDDTSMRTSPEIRALRSVSWPDFSDAAGSVRDQLRKQYSSLTLKIEHPDTTTTDLGNAYGEMGKLLMAAEYLDAAESCYLNAQALTPTEVRWSYYLGHLYRAMGQLAPSAAFFEQALKLRPDDVSTLVWLGDVYLAQGRPEAAEPLLTRALALQPRSLAALFGLGRAALARRDDLRAVEHLKQALALDQQAAAIHYPLAMAYRGLGDEKKAEAHLRQRGEGEIRPADPLMQEVQELLESSLVYEQRGTQALGRGEWATAAAYFRKGVELAPESPSLRHKLGTVFFLMEDAQGALEQFEEVVRVSPDHPQAHYSLGVLMEASGRENEAIERFSAAVRYETSYVEARLRLAGLLRRNGRLQEALAQYDQVTKIDPRVAEGPFGYAMTLAGLERYEEARDRLGEGMKRYPDYAMFAHALARLLATALDDRVRDGRRALTLMEELLEKRQNTDLGETMAMSLAELGRYEEAAAWQREAIAAAKRAGRDDLVPQMAERLQLYERRTPWRSPDPGELERFLDTLGPL